MQGRPSIASATSNGGPLQLSSSGPQVSVIGPLRTHMGLGVSPSMGHAVGFPRAQRPAVGMFGSPGGYGMHASHGGAQTSGPTPSTGSSALFRSRRRTRPKQHSDVLEAVSPVVRHGLQMLSLPGTAKSARPGQQSRGSEAVWSIARQVMHWPPPGRFANRSPGQHCA